MDPPPRVPRRLHHHEEGSGVFATSYQLTDDPSGSLPAVHARGRRSSFQSSVKEDGAFRTRLLGGLRGEALLLPSSLEAAAGAATALARPSVEKTHGRSWRSSHPAYVRGGPSLPPRRSRASSIRPQVSGPPRRTDQDQEG